MIITLEFNLPDEKEQANDALNGDQWHAIVQDLCTDMSLKIKYAEKPEEGFGDTFKDGVAWVYSLLHSIAEERTLEIWE